jgi:hypothetical protein
MRHDVSLHQPHQTLHFKLLHPHLQQVLFFHLRLQKGLPVDVCPVRVPSLSWQMIVSQSENSDIIQLKLKDGVFPPRTRSPTITHPSSRRASS